MIKDARRLRYAIGQCIRRHRDQQHMALDVLARNTGISERSLDHFELGKSEIQFQHIVRIANALGIEPEDLLKPEQA